MPMSDEQDKQGTNASFDTEIARLVVEKSFATDDEIGHAREIQKQVSDPPQSSLSAILVAEGIVTAGQIKRLRNEMDTSPASQQIPGYELLGKLGKGAMATVLKARQLSLDRIVAIKVLPKRLSENPDYVERFYKEGKAAARLNHANIVQAFDVGEAGGYHYFVMEYVAGHTVFDEIDRGKSFSEAEALDIVIQIAEALDHAHERGFIHRDVKPKNIMLTQDGVAKLADMGLAREANDIEAALQEKGRAFGTPYYISPEQIRGQVTVDFRADIYGLGGTFYHMVTGRVPFEASTPAAVMHKHLKDTLTPPDHINTKLSAGVSEIIEVMMAKRPEHRYASTKDLLLDLKAVRRGEPPLQARSVIAGDVLSGLTGEAEALDVALAPSNTRTMSSNQMMVVILLAAGLALSILLNIILALSN